VLRRFVCLAAAVALSATLVAGSRPAFVSVVVDRIEEGRWAVLEVAGPGPLDVAFYADVPVESFSAAAGFAPVAGRQVVVPVSVLGGAVRVR